MAAISEAAPEPPGHVFRGKAQKAGAERVEVEEDVLLHERTVDASYREATSDVFGHADELHEGSSRRFNSVATRNSKFIRASSDVIRSYSSSFLYGHVPPRIRVRSALSQGWVSVAVRFVEFLAAGVGTAMWIWTSRAMSNTQGRLDLTDPYIAIDAPVSAIFTCLYLLRLYSAPVRVAYVLSYKGFLDALSSIVIVTFFIGEYYGYLFRIVYLMLFLRPMVELREMGVPVGAVLQQILILLYFLISFIFVGAAIFLWVEWLNPESVQEYACDANGCINYGAAIYFVIVTMSTVGYGDITPHTFVGRLTVIAIIITALFSVPLKLQGILDIMSKRPYGASVRSRRVIGQRKIVLCGDISERSVCTVLAEMFHPSHDIDLAAYPLKVIILAPTPPSFRMETVVAGYAGAVEYVQGSPMSVSDLDRIRVTDAAAVLVLQESFFTGCPDQRDRVQVVQALAASRSMGAQGGRVIVGMFRPGSENLAVWDESRERICVVCPEVLRFKLLAASCFVPGLSTLVLNLLRAPLLISRRRKTRGHWMLEYHYGMLHHVYPLLLPRAFQGMLFEELADFLYNGFYVCLLGLDMPVPNEWASEEGHTMGAPGDRGACIFPRGHRINTDMDVGIVLATGTHILEQVSKFGASVSQRCSEPGQASEPPALGSGWGPKGLRCWGQLTYSLVHTSADHYGDEVPKAMGQDAALALLQATRAAWAAKGPRTGGPGSTGVSAEAPASHWSPCAGGSSAEEDTAHAHGDGPTLEVRGTCGGEEGHVKTEPRGQGGTPSMDREQADTNSHREADSGINALGVQWADPRDSPSKPLLHPAPRHGLEPDHSGIAALKGPLLGRVRGQGASEETGPGPPVPEEEVRHTDAARVLRGGSQESRDSCDVAGPRVGENGGAASREGSSGRDTERGGGVRNSVVLGSSRHWQGLEGLRRAFHAAMQWGPRSSEALCRDPPPDAVLSAHEEDILLHLERHTVEDARKMRGHVLVCIAGAWPANLFHLLANLHRAHRSFLRASTCSPEGGSLNLSTAQLTAEDAPWATPHRNPGHPPPGGGHVQSGHVLSHGHHVEGGPGSVHRVGPAGADVCPIQGAPAAYQARPAPLRVVILCPTPPDSLQWGRVGVFPGTYFLRGDPRRGLGLVRSGALTAAKVLVLSSEGRGAGGPDSDSQADIDNANVAARLDALRQSIEDLLPPSTREIGMHVAEREGSPLTRDTAQFQEPRHEGLVAAWPPTTAVQEASDRKESHAAPAAFGMPGGDPLTVPPPHGAQDWAPERGAHSPVLVEVQQERSLQYFQPMYTLDRRRASPKTYKRNKDAAFSFCPVFQSGKVLCSTSLSSLLCASFYNKRVQSIMCQLVMGGVTSMGGLSGKGQTGVQARSQGIQLRSIPESHKGAVYGDLFNYLLREKLWLSLGLYRAKGTQGSIAPFVHTNPVPWTVVGHEDFVYVIHLE